MQLSNSHPLLRNLQKSKGLTILSIVGYLLVPLSIAAYAFYTWNDPASRLIVSQPTKDYYAPSVPVAYTPPEPQEPTHKPVSSPKPQSVPSEPQKPATDAQNVQVQLASINPKEDKKDEDKPSKPDSKPELPNETPHPDTNQPSSDTLKPDDKPVSDPSQTPDPVVVPDEARSL